MSRFRSCALSAILLVGCQSGSRGNGVGNGVGGAGGTDDGGSGSSGDGGASPDLAPAAYPDGPYGHQKGDVLPNLSLAGYRLTPSQTDSTQLSWDTSIQLSDYYAKPSCKCMLITIGARWCGACQMEQPQLISDVSGDPSFCVLGVVQEGLVQQTLATQRDVDLWTQHFQQNFTVTQGTSRTELLLSGFGPEIGLPFSFVVDPATMKVLDVLQGFSPQIHDYAVSLCPG
jgi:hypothetical protein